MTLLSKRGLLSVSWTHVDESFTLSLLLDLSLTRLPCHVRFAADCCSGLRPQVGQTSLDGFTLELNTWKSMPLRSFLWWCCDWQSTRCWNVISHCFTMHLTILSLFYNAFNNFLFFDTTAGDCVCIWCRCLLKHWEVLFDYCCCWWWWFYRAEGILLDMKMLVWIMNPQIPLLTRYLLLSSFLIHNHIHAHQIAQSD